MKLHRVLLSVIVIGSASTFTAAAQSVPDPSAPQPGLIPPGGSARDGFTRSGTDILYTRQGITARVTNEVRLPSGITVRPDGTVIRPDGSRTSLGANQILTLDGRIADAALSPSGTAPVSAVVPGRPAALVASSPLEGITVSGNQAYVTKAGMTAKLSTELRFENGLRFRPNGTMTLPNGSESTLRPNQMVTMRGQIIEAPPSAR